MRLPLLLLPLCVLALTSPERTTQGGTGDGVGTPTAQNTKPLEQSWKSLLGDAIVRLGSLFSKSNETVISDSSNDTIDNNLFEGDIILSRNKRLSNARAKRQIMKSALKWPDNTVYYSFKEDVGAEKRLAVKNAVGEWQRRTCVNFVEDPTAQYRVQIENGGGCASALGFRGGVQQMTLADGCGIVAGTVAHEFGHALGLVHTQSREDRDNYINYNVQGGGGFKDQNGKTPIHYFTPYEYGSIMHYPINLYGAQENALEPKDRRYDYTLGGKLLTFYDVMGVNEFYECGGCARCKNGGVPSVRDCTVCECPAGFGGQYCNERPNTCGKTTAVATTEWQEEIITVGKNDNSVRDDYDICNTWITAPRGRLIEVKIVEMTNPNCNYGCTLNGIEIKGDKDPRITNPRNCCPESVGTIVQSYQNPTPVITYARAGSATFKIQYRYSGACLDSYPYMCNAEYCASGDDFRTKKYNCGVTCGLCGQKDPVCEDDETCPAILEYSTCDDLLKGGVYEDADVEYYCGKSCGYCGNGTTTTVTTTTVTTTKATTTTAAKVNPEGTNSTNCQERNACDKVYSDIVDGAERQYYCGNNCMDCINLEICEDSQFCAKLMKESGENTCDSLFKYLDYNRELMDVYCYKSCSFLC